MLQAIRFVNVQFQALVHIWKRNANPSDFVWLARFRLLMIYVVIKSVLLLVVGVVGVNIRADFTLASFNTTLLLWTGTLLSICASILLLLLGLGLASKRWPRLAGMVILCIADICVLVAVFYACVTGSFWLLLIVLVVISCTTPLFVERISRFAKNYEHSKYQLARMQRDLEKLLQQHEQELARAIESERSSLRREIHDKLMQELSAVLLQTSVMLMHNSVDGNVQLSATEAAKMETSLRRVATEARNVMQALKPTQSQSIEIRGE